MNIIKTYYLVLRFLLFGLMPLYTNAQIYIAGKQTNGAGKSNIITAVPFLLIVPDARTGAMGNVGVAIPGDANSSSSNPAKLIFLEKSYGAAFSYSPWLNQLASNINLTYFSGYFKADVRNTVGISLRYFSLGDVQLTDLNQQQLGIVNPNEFSLDFSYARSFGSNFSLGSSIRYVSSNLSAGREAAELGKAGKAFAMDIGGLYKSQSILFGNEAVVSVGINVSNIGTKLSYTDSGHEYFLPANFKIGGAATFLIDDFNTFTLGLDFNKLLVPTQPIYDQGGNIMKGKNPDRSVLEGTFGSFSDAPGGFAEEMQEVGVSAGMEYWYNKQFAIRAGYNYEDPAKGSNSYLTLGGGFRYNVFNVDLSYLVADVQKVPLANTLRFGLSFYFDEKK